MNNRRFEQRGNFFKTDVITGRSMIITRADRELLVGVMYEKQPKDTLSSIIESSNGILTLDNLEEYNSDAQIHRCQ